MPDKQVEVKVLTDVEAAKVEALENKINELQRQRLAVNIEANTQKLNEIQDKIDGIDTVIETSVDLSDEELEELKSELADLESKKLDLQLDIEKDKLEDTKLEIEDLDDTEIDIQVNNISAMEAIDQIGQGFDRLKQGASEVGQQLGSVLESAGKQETNKTFLEMAVGADQAAKSMNEINTVVQQLPGDDTIMQGLLSSAVAKDASLTTQALTDMGNAAADYFAAMSFYGKSATEAQQDMTNYILAGNTAELERSPILQGHIDKLKEGTTVQERAKLLQEALNEEHWGGMSQQDTYNNKLETFNGMLERGRYNLGGMFQEGAKWGMDFLMQLDASTNGLVGMGIALAGFASPVADTIMGLGQMATGFKAIKDLGFLKWFKELEIVQKAYALFTEGTLIPTQIAEGIAGNFSISWMLIAVAIGIALGLAFLYLYENCDWFRQGVDALAATLQWLAGVITDSVMGTIQWLSDEFNNFTAQIGLNTNDWVQAILGFLLFLPQIPMLLGVALINAIANALGFQGNFTDTMRNAAIDGVNGFVSFVTNLPSRLWNLLLQALQGVYNFGANFISGLVSRAQAAVSGFYNAVLGIPRAIQQCLDWAYNIIMSHPIVQAAIWLGQAIASGLSAIGLGQKSPGKIVKAIKQELIWSQEEMESSDLPKASENLGANIASRFNPNLSTSNVLIAGAGRPTGDTIINVYGDVDSDNRVKQIVEAVRMELEFDNKTAGRTV